MMASTASQRTAPLMNKAIRISAVETIFAKGGDRESPMIACVRVKLWLINCGADRLKLASLATPRRFCGELPGSNSLPVFTESVSYAKWWLR